jgi:hypothetical protein
MGFKMLMQLDNLPDQPAYGVPGFLSRTELRGVKIAARQTGTLAGEHLERALDFSCHLYERQSVICMIPSEISR